MLKNKDKIEDKDLILMIKNECNSDAMETLIDIHQNLYYSTAHRFHKKHPYSNLEDLLSDLYIVFNSAVDKFDPNRNTKFSTYVSYRAYWHFLNCNKNTNKSHSMEVSDIDKIQQSQNKYHTFESNVKDMNDYLFSILNQLEDKRISLIYKYRFIVGGKSNKIMSWREVARNLSKETGNPISISHCINLFTKSKQLLAAKLNGNNNFDSV